MGLAAAALAIAIPASASGDELVMRPNLVIKDKQVYSFDEDGVRLGPAARPIGWDEIVKATLAKDQARFDRLRDQLSDPLREIKKGPRRWHVRVVAASSRGALSHVRDPSFELGVHGCPGAHVGAVGAAPVRRSRSSHTSSV